MISNVPFLSILIFGTYGAGAQDLPSLSKTLSANGTDTNGLDVQTELYIVSGVFGGVIIFLISMVLVLAYAISTLKTQVARTVRTISASNPVKSPAIPNMTGQVNKGYMPDNLSYGHKFEPVHQNNRLESKIELDDDLSVRRQESRPGSHQGGYQGAQHGGQQGGYQGGQGGGARYSWEPLQRRQEPDQRLPRLGYQQNN